MKLTSDVVKKISSIKGEPKWMLDFRLTSLCKSLTVTSGVEAVFSFSFDFTSPHILLISSRAAISQV